jgi:hypothetical protein
MLTKNILIAGLLLGAPALLHAQASNEVSLLYHGDSLWLHYQQQTILAGKLQPGTAADFDVNQQFETIDGKQYATVAIRLRNRKAFTLQGSVSGTADAIACESDPREAGLRVVRHVSGPGHSLLNNAVYNRGSDWLLSIDRENARTQIAPLGHNQFSMEVQGWEVVIRFRPSYYRQHRGLAQFVPAQYRVWQQPVVGWCSWFAYFNKIREEDVHEAADVLAEKLKPYGLEYVQIDDGYQQTPIGMPNTWLQPNSKFPSGLGNLAAYIRAKGLKPGIWTNVSFADSAAAYRHASMFVKNRQGQPAFGNWIGYVMNGNRQATLDSIVAPVYKGFKSEGWQYYKLDALRHLKYEGYNSYGANFNGMEDRNMAFRKVVSEVRRQVGPNHFLLACWGIRPELVGLADGCRIGNDGFSYAGLAQYNSYNNIVWRNDPDHIELTPQEAYRSCVATSLSGSLFMLTDKPALYRNSPLVEAARRSIPVLYTQPGQVYDVDPSRSALIHLADVEMSGSGPRPFDAGTSTTTGLFSLEIDRPFENWLVLGRLDERDAELPLIDLGLDDKQEYHVFEFWTKNYLGTCKQKFVPGEIDSTYKCQVFCFRKKQDRPQLLATNRHITCGGYELKQLQWQPGRLSGQSELVPADDYTLYVHEPEGFVFESMVTTGADLVENTKTGNVRAITIRSSAGGMVPWEVRYK